MVFIAIVAGTLIAGIGSVWLAALLSFGVLARYTQHMLSLAAGALLATAFMNLLPEAFESKASAQHLFAALLGGLVFFFLLDKAELWHHGHEHNELAALDPEPVLLHNPLTDAVPLRTANSVRGELVDYSHDPFSAHEPAGRPHRHSHHAHDHHDDEDDHHHGSGKGGGWAVLAGDSVHSFGDGILIASAFMADIRLGIVTALAVLVHEVPHHMGDLIVLRRTSSNRRAAFVKVSLAGSVTALGGLTGYALVDQLYAFLPFFLVIASSSFVYVALADLIPQLQKRLSARETAAQIVWLAIGIGLVMLVSTLAHG